MDKGEKSRVNRERMCLRFRRDPPMGLTVDVARLTFGSRRRKGDPTRIARANRIVEGEGTAGEVRKKDGEGDAAEIAHDEKTRVPSATPRVFSQSRTE